MRINDLQRIQKLIEDLRIEQYHGLSIETMDIKLHYIEMEIFKLMDKLNEDKTSNDSSVLPTPNVSSSLPETRNCLICGYFCNNEHHADNWFMPKIR